MQYPILASELTVDPLTRNYAVMTNQQAADSLNTADRQVNVTIMTGREVKANVDSAEYAALTEAKKAQLLSLVARDDLDPHGVDADIVQDIFSSGATLTALQAARVEILSRASELSLSIITAQDVSIARSL